MARINWTRKQTIVAFNVYCKVPFHKSNSRHPTIIKYAKIIDRSPSALNMKVGNFGRLDPELRKRGIVGLSNGGKLEKVIWDEFHGNWEALAYESEKIIAEFQDKSIEDSAEIDLSNIPIGLERESVVKRRVNQSFFRSTILSSYNQRCCITGMRIPELLVASHIVPWSKNKSARLDPRNGLCLNSIHDKAFDRGLITVSKKNRVLLSKHLLDMEPTDVIKDFFIKYKNQEIELPEKFVPNPDFLHYHFENIFMK